MIPSAGRLQTAEHILARIIQNKIPDAKCIMAKFDKVSEAVAEFATTTNLKIIDVKAIEREVNDVIRENLPVYEQIVRREKAETVFDLSRLPADLQEIRIVSIGDFDSRPCKDPHVQKTSKIGNFEIIKVERSGKDRYRFVFRVH